MRLSRYHVATATERLRSADIPVRAVFSTRSCEFAVIDEDRWRLLERGDLARIEEDLVEQLVDMQLVVPDDEDELGAVLARNRAAAEDNDALNLVVQPTAACQLGCGYCGQEHEAHAMDPADQRRLIQRVADRLDQGRDASGQPWREVHVSWFGAEPLLALPTLRLISRELQRLSTERHLAYSAKVTTNGLELSAEVAAELLIEHAVASVTITLDGPASTHDARRAWKSGRPSFDRIWHNLLAVARLPELANLALTVRSNIDRANAEDFLVLARMLAAEGLAKRVYLYPAAVHSWGNRADEAAPCREEFAELQIRWIHELDQLGFATALLPGPVPLVCISVAPHAEVIDAYGDVFNCSEMSQVPAYGRPNRHRIGQLRSADEPTAVPVTLSATRSGRQRSYGRPSGGPAEAPGCRGQLSEPVPEAPGARSGLAQSPATQSALAGSIGAWGDVVAAGEVPCHRCSLLPVCGGSCPKQWLEGLQPCPAFKWNLPERLALAVERAMAQARAASTQ